MPDANARIEALAKGFVAELTAIARDEILKLISGGGARVGRSVGVSRRRGEKRSPKDLAALETKFHAFVAKHPGLRIEQINAELGTRTAELALPIRKLIASKAIRTTGTKRSTKYFAKGRRK
jgi:hypothetical protein